MDSRARGQRLAPLEQACKKAAFLIQSGGLGHIVIDLVFIVIHWAHCRKVAT
jgi:hypothetical protein